MMTLAIFNDEVCQKPEAWRHLGFIHKNGTSMYSHEDINDAHVNVICDDVPENHNNFHAQMRIILGDLKLLQDAWDASSLMSSSEPAMLASLPATSTELKSRYHENSPHWGVEGDRSSLEEGVLKQFTIDGKTNPTIYQLFFPILYIIGDTMEHNKLVSLKNGPTSELPC